MADIGIRSNWTLTLETEELRLVLKALGNRLLDEDQEAAQELCNRLTRLRMNATKTALIQADKTLGAVAAGEKKKQEM